MVLPQHDANREIDFGVPDPLFVKPIEEPSSDERVIFGTTQSAAYELVRLDEAWKIVKGACLADFGRIQVGCKLAEHVKIDRSLQVKMQLRLV